MAFLDFLAKPVGGYRKSDPVTNPASGGTSYNTITPRTNMSWGGLLGSLMSDPRDRALGDYMSQRYALPSITGTENQNKDVKDLSDIVQLMKIFGMQ